MLTITFQVIVAILPKSDINYFDIQSKTWKQLSSMQQLTEVEACYCTEVIGNYLYVGAKGIRGVVIYRYDTVRNIWSTLPIPGFSGDKIDCLCHVKEHLYVIYNSLACRISYNRYNIATNQWESFVSWNTVYNLGRRGAFCNAEAAVQHKSCLYVLCAILSPCNSVLCRFDPKKNVWEQKASTKTPHFGSSLLVVNNNLYVAGGSCSLYATSSEPSGSPDVTTAAASEVYNDQENAWSVVKQTHIPPNNLGAVEIDGRVYFIINSFPVDSGITIPPGEVYPVILDEWENLKKIRKDAVLCYAPIKTENLTTENE
mgnify:CR=1 FL=1